MKKSTAKANLTSAIHDVKGTRETGWTKDDSAEVAIKILNMHPREDGNSEPLADDKVQQIKRAFDATSLQLQAVKNELEGIIDLDPTVQAQLMQLFEPEEFRKQLVGAKILKKQPRDSGKLLKNLITDDDENT